MKKLWFSILTACFLLFSFSAKAEIISHEFNGILYIDETTVEELEQLFEKYNYRYFRGKLDNAYPAIFLKKLPKDFAQIESQKYRNEVFIRILAPLALKINEELSNERHTLLRLERSLERNKTLTPEENEKLEELAVKYDYFSRNNDESRAANLINHLKVRINVIPPSILIAVAAMETNWGFSRIAQEANSLYKEKVWYTNEGLEPLENKDDGYRFKIFDNLIDSMRSYALTFNSNISYQNVWDTRIEAAARQDKLIGESIAYSLAHASNLPNFVGILDYTTAFYDLFSIDIGHLQRIK